MAGRGPALTVRYLDMLRPRFWQGGFDVLETLVVRLEELWAEYKQSR